ncbi:MAG: hypothetical protein SW833_20220 [Cyanobacteriota bacterium]|nr:hypothetical protein [Cyanobacteriota bacterium]
MKTEYSSLQITIEYKTKDSETWKNTKLSPREYFDLEADEKIDVDSIPKYNHAIEYLNKDVSQVSITRTILIDKMAQRKILIVEKFWNKGNNRLIERTESGSNSYWETILEIRIGEEPPLWEILRIGREDGIISPLYHGFLRDNEDGSQTETQIDLE